ncbi:serine hydrolase [Salegentibacter salarius]|uniref:beta-lactamase n=1 Tax=Salegentibacter salarius TaxID=435906 RepID=A0A2N0TXF7_9FLAO|nr:serine hydrolase [Salegentibacter salarius]OEY73128.1 serine hydrolase [Salegentibacter salarius]PKD19411.1 serine hydrolase [Salegentibacter salarius]SLJ99613.1 beta-lactamase class A [Salegentibacter salarius]
MKKIIALCLWMVSVTGFAQNTERNLELQQKLEALIDDFKGDVGIYVKNLETDKVVAINADTIFPTASIVKVPILVKIFDNIDKGDLNYNDTLVYSTDRIYGGSGLMQFYQDSTKTDLRTLVALMISYSDNVTSLWNQELAGGGEAINELMAELGLEYTRVNSRTDGREKDWEKYGWGQTTPREMASILVEIRNRDLISPAASDEMYRLLGNSFYQDYALSQIPPYVQAAAKQGMVNKSRSELFMVNAPSGDYVCYLATKNNEDESWEDGNEAWELQRKISALLWNYFEPNSDWKPAEGAKEILTGLKY